MLPVIMTLAAVAVITIVMSACNQATSNNPVVSPTVPTDLPTKQHAPNNPLVGQAVTTDFATEQAAAGGRHIDVRENWADFGTTFDEMRSWYVDASTANGTVVELTLQPTDLNNAAINNGSQDVYLTKLATDIRDWDREIWIRPMHEWNGDWYSWSVGINGNTKASYISAYRRIADIFRNVGATRVKFVWNVNYTNSGANTFMGAYPGDDYVDYISLDVYNLGTAEKWSAWMSFDLVAYPAYLEISTRGRPVIISEWGCGEQGGDKAQWITDAFDVIRNSGRYDLIDAVVWFDVGGYTPDYQIDTSDAARRAYNAAINYVSDPIGGGSTGAPRP
jgi:endoglucanase